MKSKKRAFSLIEVLIVIAIIALIASLAVPMVKRNRDEAAYETSIINLMQVAKAMEKHYLETGAYPLFGNWKELSAEDSPLAEYLNDVPASDGWGREYRVLTSTETEYLFEGFGYDDRDHTDYTVGVGVKLKKKKGGKKDSGS